MDRRLWLKGGAALSFFMAACQAVISVVPAAAEYFRAPPSLLQDRRMLFLIGESATLVFAFFGLYALSGARSIRRLPLLRIGLIGISVLYSLRGLFIIITLLVAAGVLEGEVLVQGLVSHVVFLAAGVAYTVGTVVNWRELRLRG
jgi:hypothetical protein